VFFIQDFINCIKKQSVIKIILMIIQSIQNRIYELRGERVMLDRDLAALYETETKRLTQSVKRNIKRFPKDFMFQLSKEEFEDIRLQVETLEISDYPLRPQIATSKNTDNTLRLQNVTSKGRGGTRYLPYAFTEQGVAMLSGVLNSDKAINMNIAIMRAFVEVRKIIYQQNDLKEQMKEIKERLGEHDAQLSQIYDAMENLLDEKAAQKKWNERPRIGFKK
jgi:phage regulator Rha-like protein